MKKILLTLVTMFVATFAMAQDYPQVTDLAELQAHAGETVIVKNVEVTAETSLSQWNTVQVTYYLELDEQVPCEGYSCQYRGMFDLQGVYNAETGKFKPEKVVAFYDFAALADFEKYAQDNKNSEIGAALVAVKSVITHVVADENVVFVNHFDVKGNIHGTAVKGDGAAELQRGDKLGLVQGTIAPEVTEGNAVMGNLTMAQGAMLTVSMGKLKKSGSGTVEYYIPASGTPDKIEYIYGNMANYAGLAAKMLVNGGTVVKEGDKFYYVEQGKKQGQDHEYRMEIVSNDINLDSYTSKTAVKCYWYGVFDFKNTSADAERFFIHSEEALPPVEVTDLEGLRAHADEVVIVKNVEVSVEGTGGAAKYYLELDEQVPFAGWSCKYAGMFDIQGTYSSTAGTFTPSKIVAVYDFANLGYYEKYAKDNLSKGIEMPQTTVGGKYVITHAIAGENVVFVNHTDVNGSATGTALVGDAVAELKRGDLIQVLYGKVVSPKVDEMNIQTFELALKSGASFEQASKPRVRSTDNAIEYYAPNGKADKVENVYGNMVTYSGLAAKMQANGGTVVKEGDKYYYVEQGKKQGQDHEYRLEIVSEDVALDEYLEEEAVNVIWCGVFDFKNSSADAERFFIHAEEEVPPTEVTTREQLVANEGQEVIIRNAVVTAVAEFWFSNYYVFEDIRINAPMFGYAGVFDLMGVYENEGFTLTEIVAVKSFASFSDYSNYVTLNEVTDLEAAIDGSYLVHYAGADYALTSFSAAGGGMMPGMSLGTAVVLRGLTGVATGDMITGLNGTYTAAGYDDEGNFAPASFVQASEVAVTVESSDNEIAYTTGMLNAPDLAYSGEMVAGLPLGITFVGGMVTSEGGKYYYTDLSYGEPIMFEIASDVVDLSQYLDQPIDVMWNGFFDFNISAPGAACFIILSEAATSVDFENIADLFENGDVTNYGMAHKLTNVLTVTYVHGSSASGYKVFLQDETGAVRFDTWSDAAGELNVGDQVTGVRGTFSASWQGLYYLENDNATFEVVSTTTVVPADVTIADLMSEGQRVMDELEILNEVSNPATVYASKLVRLSNVSLVEVDGKKYLQDERGNQMQVPNNFAKNLTTYDVMNVTGIVDWAGSMNYASLYTIHPRSQEDIVEVTAGGGDDDVIDTAEELRAHEGDTVTVYNADITAVKEGYYSTYYYLFGEIQIAGWDVTYQGVFDLQGIYQDGQFTLESVVAVKSFSSLSDYDAFAEKNPEFELGATVVNGSYPVTQVVDDMAFVSYEDSYGNAAGTVIKGIQGVERGDIITGLKGIGYPKLEEMDYTTWELIMLQAPSFELAEDCQIVVESSDNEIVYGQTEHFNYLIASPSNFVATAMRLITDGGRVSYEDDKFYYSEIINGYETNYEDVEYRIEIVSDDFMYLLGLLENTKVEVMWCGVFDYKTTSDDAMKFYIHKEMSTVAEFENIADFIANADVTDNYTTSVLKNTVTVTYCYSGGEWGPYALFVEDETGGLRIDLNEAEQLAQFTVGDQLQGFRGMIGLGWKGVYYMTVAYDKPLTYNKVGNVAVQPTDVTIEELMAEGQRVMDEAEAYVEQVTPATVYVSRLVRLVNVSLVEDEQQNKFLEDKAGNRLPVVKKFAEGFTTFDKMNVTGIIDWGGSINYSNLYTIHPRSQEDITECTGVDAVVAEGTIYMANNVIVANGAVEVAVYDVNGRTMAVVAADTVDANAYAQGVYVVRATYANGATAVAKVVR